MQRLVELISGVNQVLGRARRPPLFCEGFRVRAGDMFPYGLVIWDPPPLPPPREERSGGRCPSRAPSASDPRPPEWANGAVLVVHIRME